MRRFLSTVAGVWMMGAAISSAQDSGSTSEAEARRKFLKAREEMQTLPPTPPTEEPAKPKPRPKPVTPPVETAPKTPPKVEPAPMPEEIPDKPKPPPEPKPTKPAPKKPKESPTEPKKQPPKTLPEPVPERTSEPTKPEPPTKPRPSPGKPAAEKKPAPVPAPGPILPAPTPPSDSDVPVVIQKSGLESETGFEPPPPPSRGGFWSWGKGPTYKYLTKGIRSEIDRAGVKKRRWRYIVVHNSGSRQGNAKIFDYYHKHTRKMPNGLAYHFVVGNGSSSGNGEIEIGSRWRRQINGGHVHSDYLNNIALGICLVGDFNRDHPTKEQLEATDELVRYLRIRVGKIDRKVAIVKAHKAINPPRWPTDCPGDRFPYSWLRARFE